MVDTMILSNGVGLACPQIGLSNQLIVCLDPRNSKTYILCNPEIIKKEGRQTSIQGCLSFPNIFRIVESPEKITVRYQDLKGKRKSIQADGILAECIFHECLHLQGILLIDPQSKKY